MFVAYEICENFTKYYKTTQRFDSAHAVFHSIKRMKPVQSALEF